MSDHPATSPVQDDCHRQGCDRRWIVTVGFRHRDETRNYCGPCANEAADVMGAYPIEWREGVPPDA